MKNNPGDNAQMPDHVGKLELLRRTEENADGVREGSADNKPETKV